MLNKVFAKVAHKSAAQVPEPPKPEPSAKTQAPGSQGLDLVALRKSASPEVRDCAVRLSHALNLAERDARVMRQIHSALRPYCEGGALPPGLAEQVASLESCVQERGGLSALAALPDELLANVMQHLGPKDLVAVGATCKTLRGPGREDALWAYHKVAKLSNVALACLPQDIKQKAEVRLAAWILECDAVRGPYGPPRVLRDSFDGERLVSPSGLEALAQAYDRLARRVIRFQQPSHGSGFEALQPFKPSLRLQEGMKRALVESQDRVRWMYVTAADVVEIAQIFLAQGQSVILTTDDPQAVALLRKKFQEPLAAPLPAHISVIWLEGGCRKKLVAPDLRLPG